MWRSLLLGLLTPSHTVHAGIIATPRSCRACAAQAALWPQMEWNVRRVLGNDVSAISTLRCLKLFLERLGANYLDAHTSHALASAYTPLVRPEVWVRVMVWV